MSTATSAAIGAPTGALTYSQNPAHQHWLEQAIAQLQGVAGTVHLADPAPGEGLHLCAAVRIPPPVLAVIGHIARGKGMAGLALVRKQPVQTCDLRTDASGDVRPGAKAVDAQAAIAVPVLDAGGQVLAVVGFAWNQPGDLPAAQQRQVQDKVLEFRALLQAAPRTPGRQSVFTPF